MTVDTERNRVKTTETTFELIELLTERDGAGITELATELGVAKSTVHRHLTTLERLEYVVESDGVYHTGLRFLNIGEKTRQRSEAYQLAAEKVTELADETEERAQFIVEEHGQGVYVFRATGQRAVETDSEVGKRIPIHATAAGKAILAHSPEEKVDAIVERCGLSGVTENTITDRQALLAELETIRERGYSINNQENTIGLKAVGVPVRYEDGTVVGAVSVSGPTYRMQDEYLDDTLLELLLGTVNELELNIQYS